MSRVDEAMRRAAELGTGRRAPRERTINGIDPVEVAHETFPVEIGDRRLRPVAPPVAPPAIAPPAIAPPMMPADPAVPDAIRSRSETVQPLRDRLAEELTGKVVVDPEMRTAFREQYRRLAATLHEAQAASGLRVILIASAVASEGKSLTAANLALTFSESYQRNVLLIDGDLRRPSLDALFGIESAAGLSEGLISTDDRKLPLHAVSPRLTVLPGGHPSSDPFAGLTGDRMRRLITEARATFDWVIIDTPPIGILPDANLLAAMADGVVLVVRADDTPFDQVQRAVEALGRDRILGVVLNRAREAQQADYHNRYYAPRSQAGRRA